MTEEISPGTFHGSDGVEDWRVVFEGACAHFRTRTFGAGLALWTRSAGWPKLRSTTPTSTCDTAP